MGRFHSLPEGSAVFPLQLSSFTQDQKITLWYSVPMVLALLQAGGRLEERDFAALRWVLFAGEVFPTKHLRTLMERLLHPRYPTFTDRPKRMFAPTMRSNLFRWNKRRRSRSAKLAQILTSFRSTHKEKSRHDQRGRPFYARESTVMQGYYGCPEALRSVFHPQPLYRGPQQPPWAPVWSLMLGGHMADAILLAKNRLAPTVE